MQEYNLICTFVFVAYSTVMTVSFRTDRSEQTVETQIRLLLEEESDQGVNCLWEQSDLGLHCLLFHLHHFDKIPSGLAYLNVR